MNNLVKTFESRRNLKSKYKKWPFGRGSSTVFQIELSRLKILKVFSFLSYLMYFVSLSSSLNFVKLSVISISLASCENTVDTINNNPNDIIKAFICLKLESRHKIQPAYRRQGHKIRKMMNWFNHPLV